MPRVAAILAWISVLYAAAVQSAESSVAEKMLARIPEGVDQVFVSPSGQTVAWVQKNGAKASIVVNGEAGEAYDEVSLLQFNPAHNSVSYLARQGESYRVVRGKNKGEPFDAIPYLWCGPGGPLYSAGEKGDFGRGKVTRPEGLPQLQNVHDGEALAYWGVKDNAWHFVLNETAGPAFVRSDHMEADGGAIFVVSSDGRFAAYEARDKNQKWRVVANDKQGPIYDSVSLFGITRDGQPVYKGQSSNIATLHVGERVAGKYGYLSQAVFSHDGSTVISNASTEINGQMTIYLDGKAVAQHFAQGPIILSPKADHFAYFSMGTGKVTPAVDGKPAAKSYEYCSDRPVFSPDGTVVAYAAKPNANKFVMVVNDVESEQFDFIYGPPVFSPDSKTVGYIAASFENKNLDQNFVVIGDKRGDVHRSVMGMAFSADSKHVAYGASDGANAFSVVEDGKQGALFSAIQTPLLFMKNGSVVYMAKTIAGKSVIVVGEKIYDRDEAIVTPVSITEDGSQAAYGAQKGNEIWWRVVSE